MSIRKAKHVAGFLPKLNIIYTLPTQNATKDFVIPKVNMLITRNPAVQALITQDAIQLKKVGERFIYYRGTKSKTAAISTSADLLVMDEYDRSDQSVLNVHDSRLQASEYAWRWRFSNPSVPNYGVHDLWTTCQGARYRCG
jgi:phage terminase large subunit GpA-like protein